MEIAKRVHTEVTIENRRYSQKKRIATVVASSYALFLGAYDDPCGCDYLNLMKDAVRCALQDIEMVELEDIVSITMEKVWDYIFVEKKYKKLNESLFFRFNNQNQIFVLFANAVYENQDADVYTFVKVLWQYDGDYVKVAFDTKGRFRKSIIIDTGDTASTNSFFHYKAYLNGGLMDTGSKMHQIPWVGIEDKRIFRRIRKTPNLGDEILRDPEKMYGENMPEMYVMAINKYIWSGVDPIAQAIDNNSDSIGLLLQFGTFCYYTGGDLPSAGEDELAKNLNDKYSHFRLTAFKCGHHGSHYSTSQYFLDTLKPKIALISCGKHDGYKHPDQEVINILHKDKNIRYFFLTSCYYDRDYIPASKPNEEKYPTQLKCWGNKSRVAGADEKEGDEYKGNIRIYIYESNLTNNGGLFWVEYYDWDKDGYVLERVKY